MSFIKASDRIEGRYGNAFLLAVAGSALLPALAIFVLSAFDTGPMRFDIGAVLAITLIAFVIAFAVIGLAALIIGLPLTWFLARNRLEQPWTYPLAGLIAGASLVIYFPVLSGDLRGESILEFLPWAPIGALPGCLCGTIWWWTYRRHMQDLGDERG